MTDPRQFATRLLVLIGVMIGGLLLRSWFVVGAGGVGLCSVVSLRIWSRRSSGHDSALWPVAWLFWSLGAAMLGMFAYLEFFARAFVPTRVVLGVVVLLPAAYFWLIAWCLSYFAMTGRRWAGADRVGRFFGRLNGPIVMKRRPERR